MKSSSVIDMHQATLHLRRHFTDIRTVGDWAARMGYQRTEFSRMFKKVHRQAPKEALIQIRTSMLLLFLVQNPTLKHYEVARTFGLRDEKALYDYLKYHRDHSPTELKAAWLRTASGNPRP